MKVVKCLILQYQQQFETRHEVSPLNTFVLIFRNEIDANIHLHVLAPSVRCIMTILCNRSLLNISSFTARQHFMASIFVYITAIRGTRLKTN